MNEILRMYKELRIINVGNITDRLLKASKGDLFLVYNTLRGTYEVHSIRSFKMNGISINSVVDESMLNQEIIEIVKSCNIARFGKDLQQDREYLNKILDNREDEGMKRLLEKGRKMMTMALGRDV